VVRQSKASNGSNGIVWKQALSSEPEFFFFASDAGYKLALPSRVGFGWREPMRRTLKIAVLILGMAFAGLAARADEMVGSGMSKPMVVVVDRGNVREHPNPQAKILTTLGRNAKVMVIGTANGGGWAIVLVDGLRGFMDFVQLADAPEDRTVSQAGTGTNASRTMIVAVDQGNLREHSNLQGQLLATLPRGTTVTVIGTANGGGWAHVIYNNLDGYMDFVQLAEAAPAPGPYPAERIVNSVGGTIHQTPSSQSPLLTILPPGSRVQVIGSLSGGAWVHVVANGVDGYMDSTQLQ